MMAAEDRRKELKQLAEHIEKLISDLPRRPVDDSYQSPSQWRERQNYYEAVRALEAHLTENLGFRISYLGGAVSIRGNGLYCVDRDLVGALYAWVEKARAWIVFTQGGM